MARPASGLFENQKLKYFWWYRNEAQNVHGGRRMIYRLLNKASKIHVLFGTFLLFLGNNISREGC
jgi:hypothetical protein